MDILEVSLTKEQWEKVVSVLIQHADEYFSLEIASIADNIEDQTTI